MYFLDTSTTTYLLTDDALNLINFFAQFFAVSFALLFFFLSIIIILLIFK